MATAAPISPVSPIQIPCKLNIDSAFEEEFCYPLCPTPLFVPTSTIAPTTVSPCPRAAHASTPTTFSPSKRTRTSEFAKTCVEACPSPRKRQMQEKHRVRFRADSKKFDGLRTISEALELTVWSFYTVQSIHSADDILSLFEKPQYLSVFQQVGSAINKLAEVLEQTETTCVDATVPVLPRGGGRGLLLGRAHIPTFKQLRDMFALALERRA